MLPVPNRPNCRPLRVVGPIAPCICNLPQNQWVKRSAKFIADNILKNLDDYDASMTTVKCSDGSFIAQSLNDAVNSFKGIRYATAQRFEPPVEYRHVDAPYEAGDYGSSPMQTPGMLEQLLGMTDDSFDEDCLFLNIYAPASKSDKPRPVLFWIYGGGFVNGSSSIAWYDGSNLVQQADAIVVSINYRLGVFGFLGTSNLGLLDQICALKWVNRNIEAFGGDPKNVTIFGESAGGASVVALMAAPGAQPYFAKAWAMSPSIGQYSTIERAKQQTLDLLKHAGVSSKKDLTRLSASALLAVQQKVIASSAEPFSAFAPTQDGVVLPLNLLDAAATNPKPFVIGTNKDESRLWLMFDPNENQLDETGAMAALIKRTDNATDVWSVYKSCRPTYNPSQIVAAYDSDANFRKHAWSLLSRREEKSCVSWSYWFTWASPTFDGLLGSCHALDIPFFFANEGITGADVIIGSGEVQKTLSSKASKSLTMFAKTGKPEWPQYNSADRPTFVFDNECKLVQQPDTELYDYWVLLGANETV
jgi:para-nitrobenzyl esterase